MGGLSLRPKPIVGALAALAVCAALPAAARPGARARGQRPPSAPAPPPSTPNHPEGTRRPTPDVGRPVSLELLPASITLDSPRTEQAFLVTGRYADGTERDLTDAAKWSLGK